MKGTCYRESQEMERAERRWNRVERKRTDEFYESEEDECGWG